MLRLSLLLFVSTFTVCSFAQASPIDTTNGATGDTTIPRASINASKAKALDPLLNPALEQEEDLEEVLPRNTELEHQIIAATGFLSLSQQVKYSAQRLIQQSSAQAGSGGIEIKHAQHFAIAKNLAKQWAQDVWQQRLLDLIDARSEAEQQLILKQLANPMLQAAQYKEKQAIGAQHTDKYQRYMSKLRQQPPSASRWKLVENIDKASGFSQMIIQVRETVIKEISQQVKGWNAPKHWQDDARKEVVEFLFYAYRTTPNSELEQIVRSFKQYELSRFYAGVQQEISKR